MNQISFSHDKLIYLRKIGCCLKCSLRYCGVIFSGHSFKPEQLISEATNVDPYPCVACLGILQDRQSKHYLDKIKREIEELNYDCDTFSLTLSIPSAIQIREHVLQIYLSQDKFFSTNSCDDKVKVQSIKDVCKWYLSQKIEYWIHKRMQTVNLSSLTIDIVICYEEDNKECSDLMTKYGKLFQDASFSSLKAGKNVAKKTIDVIINTISDEQFLKYFPEPPKIPPSSISVDKLTFRHSSIYIGGRYIKLSRRLCQTPWLSNSKYKTPSIQELICNHIADHTKAESTKFLSSGREDVDVRTLLFGRPFAVEIINPRVTKTLQDDLSYLNYKININSHKVQVKSGLQILMKNDLKRLKEGEYSKSKSYRALCIYRKDTHSSFIIEKLQKLRNLNIIQNTPVRVLHRRALSPRQRVIYELRARLPNSRELQNYQEKINYVSNEYNFLIIDLKTQAGTYVKEFVHGDFGRTIPNLCGILETVIDIVALDVTNIALEWP